MPSTQGSKGEPEVSITPSDTIKGLDKNIHATNLLNTIDLESMAVNQNKEIEDIKDMLNQLNTDDLNESDRGMLGKEKEEGTEEKTR